MKRMICSTWPQLNSWAIPFYSRLPREGVGKVFALCAIPKICSLLCIPLAARLGALLAMGVFIWKRPYLQLVISKCNSSLILMATWYILGNENAAYNAVTRS